MDADLKRIGGIGLRERLWAFRDEVMVCELLAGRSNKWDNTLRAEPDLWIATVWRDVYGFPARRKGMCSRKEVLVEGRFSGKADPKDGLTVANCMDPKARRVLEFLVPILYPERPSKTTSTLASTLSSAYSRERLVDFGEMFREVVWRW